MALMAPRDRNILTKTQQETLEALRRWIEQKGQSPTLAELAGVLGIKLATVADRIRGLQKKGFVTRNSRKWRGLEITGESSLQFGSRLVNIPLVASVGADNMDIFAEQEFGQFLQVQEKLLGGHRDIFAVLVRGNSMKDAGIFDGDYILAESADFTNVASGEKVIAILGDMIVLKRIEKGNGSVILYPENNSGLYKPIVIADDREDFKVIGRLIDVLRFSDPEDYRFVPETY